MRYGWLQQLSNPTQITISLSFCPISKAISLTLFILGFPFLIVLRTYFGDVGSAAGIQLRSPDGDRLG
jgi:hypothetical protein